MPTDHTTWELVRIPDMASDMVNALPAGLYGQPRLEAFVRALGHGCQMLEDRVHDTALALSLDGAENEHLDLVGKLVGERRDGLADGLYRRFIAARLLANRCEGTVDQLLEIVRILTQPEAYAHFIYSPSKAGFKLYFQRSAALPDEVVDRVTRLLLSVKPAGRSMLLVEILAPAIGDPGNTVFTTGTLGTGVLSRQLYP